jgi:hypothetical protein
MLKKGPCDDAGAFSSPEDFNLMPEAKSVRLLLGGSLRHHPGAQCGELDVELAAPVTVREFLALVGVAVEQARIVFVNHKKAFLNTRVNPGDRVAVFPPELAFNLYVALEMAHHGELEGEG